VNGSAPASSYFTRVADVPSRLRLRSSHSVQCKTRLVTSVVFVLCVSDYAQYEHSLNSIQ